MRPSIHACLLVTAALTAAAPIAVAAPAARSFDLVTYTPPDGFTVDDSNPDHVSIVRSGTRTYCVIGIYAGDAASGDLDASFAAQWQRVVPTTADAVAAPAPTRGEVGTAHAAFGGAMSAIKGQPVFVFLTVADAGASVVTIIVLTPSLDDFKTYTPAIQAMLASLVVRRVEPSAPPPAPAAPAAPGAPARPLTVADLAGDWKHDDHAISTYVSASTGAYAGFRAIETREAWSITAKGVLAIDFYGVTAGNGGPHAVTEKRVASVSVSPDGVLAIHYKKGQGADTLYLIRGWQDTPDGTILRLNGPWYLPKGIDADVRRDPSIGTNLDEYWVRPRKKAP